jgi:hypothetical protein
LPPRDVATPLASSALAMVRADVTPLRSISAMMGGDVPGEAIRIGLQTGGCLAAGLFKPRISENDAAILGRCQTRRLAPIALGDESTIQLAGPATQRNRLAVGRSPRIRKLFCWNRPLSIWVDHDT